MSSKIKVNAYMYSSLDLNNLEAEKSYFEIRQKLRLFCVYERGGTQYF